MGKLQKEINKLPKQYYLVCLEIIGKLVRKEFIGLDIAKLKGHKYVFRVRSGRLRIIYQFDGMKVIVLSVSLRSEKTYRGF